ncbi:hypothetical protein [Phyllobacterium sp. 1468]|nr:hypothetical protein [Phyllobacterium sp. 1468]
MTRTAYDLLSITLPILVLALIASIPRNEPPTIDRLSLGALAQ